MHCACMPSTWISHSLFSCSQSEVGEGTFVFKASDAGEISQVIDWRIKNAFQSTGSPCEVGADNSPPPPQVPGVCCIVTVRMHNAVWYWSREQVAYRSGHPPIIALLAKFTKISTCWLNTHGKSQQLNRQQQQKTFSYIDVKHCDAWKCGYLEMVS